MRLFGVSMVRNEADIIEASIRHNLTVLDGLEVVDHRSTDETADILARLGAERLPLRILREETTGFFQAETLTDLARKAFARDGADFVFPIDADEFIRTPSRLVLEQALAQIPPSAHGCVQWMTYVPASFGAFGPSHLSRRVGHERHGNHKCVIGRSFAQREAQYLVSGSHLVDDPSEPRPPLHVRLRPEAVALAHCPVRSAEQLTRKVSLGYPAHLATEPANDQQASHWLELCTELSTEAELSAERLMEIACNYGVPRDKWLSLDMIELVDDPVDLGHAHVNAGTAR
jgi:Glycosyl transferase family 2